MPQLHSSIHIFPHVDITSAYGAGCRTPAFIGADVLHRAIFVFHTDQGSKFHAVAVAVSLEGIGRTQMSHCPAVTQNSAHRIIFLQSIGNIIPQKGQFFAVIHPSGRQVILCNRLSVQIQLKNAQCRCKQRSTFHRSLQGEGLTEIWRWISVGIVTALIRTGGVGDPFGIKQHGHPPFSQMIDIIIANLL